jgi:hypothetical protein
MRKRNPIELLTCYGIQCEFYLVFFSFKINFLIFLDCFDLLISNINFKKYYSNIFLNKKTTTATELIKLLQLYMNQ